ncbi:MAG: ribosome silencing factor [Herminiimonas sp.]|nr:ribosome silencing factor [Herminiimonas sp.]
MDIKKLQAIVIDALEDVKAQDIKVFDTVHLTSLFDRIAVVSGTSNRQTKALAASVRDKVKENGGTILSIEGEDTGEWVLVDLGDMIVHIMQPAIRAYYRLEEIWGEKEIKLGAAKRVSQRTASEPQGAAPKKAAGRHLTTGASSGEDVAAKPARKTPARKVGAKTAATRTAATKTAAVKAPRKTAAAGQPAGKTVKVAKTKTAVVSAKAAAARKAPVKRAAPKKKAAE